MESQQGEINKKRTKTPHKCFRTNDCKICNPDFHKKSLKFNYSYPDGQHIRPIVSLENGGYTQFRAFKYQHVNLVLSAVSWDHNYCRIFTKQTECPRRLGASECQGSLRLELHQSMFQNIIKYFGYPTVDLFASRLCHQLPQHVSWKPDTNSIATDVMQQCWNKIFPYTFPPFQSHKSNFEKGLPRKGKANDNT